jgi:hypothetical protein
MESPKLARSYLDPDAVGPLPRSPLADDSDELSAARTLLRLPMSTTQEIRPTDVVDEYDPNRPTSVAPVGYDTAELTLPRRRVGAYVLGGAGALAVILVALVLRGPSGSGEIHAWSVPAAPARSVVVPPPALPTATTPAPATTIGTLRIDEGVQGQRVTVDGVVLTVPAALVRCGAHDVAIGSVDRRRTIDVPCGGEVTLYR